MTTGKYLAVQRSMLRAESATEFRSMLDRIRREAGLSCGQIAVKAGIPRSQAYALVDAKRSALPNKPDQVIAFLRACNLSPMHADIVMDRLSDLKRRHVAEGVAVQGHSEVVDFTGEGRASTAEPLSDTAPPRAGHDREGIVVNMGKLTRARRSNNTPLVHLVHYVLASDERTRRANRLLLTLGFVLSLVLVALGGVLILVPDAIRAWVVGGFAGSVAVSMLIFIRAVVRSYD
ncbi:hypothetical protein ACQPZF_11400 [Actinosynnema sp. CS-041913]|uniref:hypothetical protein n=1 Tax=Actinosynnema sp. CS-041913 TaxID=3239917 RepID=UPI003D8B3B5B